MRAPCAREAARCRTRATALERALLRRHGASIHCPWESSEAARSPSARVSTAGTAAISTAAFVFETSFASPAPATPA